jgi:CRP-like cAMP-binding protein
MLFHRHGELGKAYADGEIVVPQGEVCDRLYVVQSGAVRAIHVEDCRQVALSLLGPGETFGLNSFFRGQPMPHSMVAQGPARVLTIDRKLFLQRVGDDPTLAFEIVRRLLERLTAAGERSVRLSLAAKEQPVP